MRQAQLALVEEAGISGLVDLVYTLSPGVRALGPPRRLPLLELCLPALKTMSAAQYTLFKRILLGLIRADANTELHEWCLYQLLRHYLDPEFIKVKPSRPRYAKLEQVAYHVRAVLSVLAHEGSGEAATAFRLGADELRLRQHGDPAPGPVQRGRLQQGGERAGRLLPAAQAAPAQGHGPGRRRRRPAQPGGAGDHRQRGGSDGLSGAGRKA